MSMNFFDRWVNFCLRLTHKPEIVIAGVQRIHRGVTWVVKGDEFLDGSMSLAKSGYTGNKIKQLFRNYFDRASLDRSKSDLMWRIVNKKYGSGVSLFRGQPKKNTKQDYCMTAMVVSFYPQKKRCHVDIFYRTAEAIKRFRGDLVFLTEYIIPEFKEHFEKAPLDSVTFHFANITLHPMYWVLLVASLDPAEVIEHLEEVKEDNPKLFRSIMYWSWRYLVDESQSIDSYSSARQVRVIAERMTDPQKLKKFSAYVRSSLLKDLESYPKSVQKWSKDNDL